MQHARLGHRPKRLVRGVDDNVRPACERALWEGGVQAEVGPVRLVNNERDAFVVTQLGQNCRTHNQADDISSDSGACHDKQLVHIASLAIYPLAAQLQICDFNS